MILEFGRRRKRSESSDPDHESPALVDMFPRRRDGRKSADWGGVIEVLSIEHHGIASLLDTLEGLAARLEKAKIPDYELLLDALPKQYRAA